MSKNICEICGKTYDTVAEKQACEAQGEPPQLYEVGLKIDESGEIIGTKVVFRNGHKRSYLIKSLSATQNNFSMLETEVTEYIREVKSRVTYTIEVDIAPLWRMQFVLLSYIARREKYQTTHLLMSLFSREQESWKMRNSLELTRFPRIEAKFRERIEWLLQHTVSIQEYPIIDRERIMDTIFKMDQIERDQNRKPLIQNK